ncbi:unnamed protein product, partial [Prorocentrum cordatum]
LAGCRDGALADRPGSGRGRCRDGGGHLGGSAQPGRVRGASRPCPPRVAQGLPGARRAAGACARGPGGEPREFRARQGAREGSPGVAGAGAADGVPVHVRSPPDRPRPGRGACPAGREAGACSD